MIFIKPHSTAGVPERRWTRGDMRAVTNVAAALLREQSVADLTLSHGALRARLPYRTVSARFGSTDALLADICLAQLISAPLIIDRQKSPPDRVVGDVLQERRFSRADGLTSWPLRHSYVGLIRSLCWLAWQLVMARISAGAACSFGAATAAATFPVEYVMPQK